MWREVVFARDALAGDPDAAAERLGLTAAEQRAVLNQARARLRELLAQRFAGGGGR